MELIQDQRVLVVAVLLTIFLGVTNTASLQRPSSCSKKNMLFQNRHVYTYDYTVYVSSAFLGASPSMSASKLSCTVTIKVPRRCEHIMELSDCSLLERVKGAEDTYLVVSSANQFLEDLQRYSIYFQMNSGVIIEDSILANDQDTLQVLNFKRGIISALQFPILETDDNNPANMTDIFGRCPVQYELGESLATKSFISKRNLKHCDLPNVYTKQMNMLPGPSIGQMVGGVTEKPINEFIYPFEMPVSCQHDIIEDKTIATVDCLQMQYFKPLAYTGDYLVTAMTNVSQRLEFKKSESKKSPRPDLSLTGQSVIDFKFDFGVHFNHASTVEDIRNSLTALVQKFVQSNDNDGFEAVPGMFGVFVEKLRAAEQDVIEELIVEVFNCENTCQYEVKIAEERFFLDGLESCGTESCLQVFLLCMKQGHTSSVETVSFLQGLKDLPLISETLLEQVFDYCKSSEETTCWLTLGTMLSKSSVTSSEDIKEDSILYQVLDHLHDTIKKNCVSGIKLDTERKLNTAVKTISNIGYKIRKLFLAKLSAEQRTPVLQACLQNSLIPTSVKISLIQNAGKAVSEMGYKDLPQFMVDAFLALLKDGTQDTSIRALSFSLLMKTTDSNMIKNLVDIMMMEDNTVQMKAYMTSSVRTLLQNDAPDVKVVRDAWEKVKDEKYFNPRFYHFDPYSVSFSKSIAGGYFFKIPISEIFGGQIEADFIYDTSNRIFSTLKTAINYHYGEEKHNLFLFMIRIKGFDLIMDVLLKRINMTPQEMYELYKTLRARAQGEGQGDDKIVKFQQNIVKAVDKILKEVNHPAELDFDVSIDVSVKGKEVMFGSLQELLSFLRKIQAKSSPKVSLAQAFLKNLMYGLKRKAFKSKELVGLVRDLPTCAGLPLNLTLHAYGTHIIEGTIQSNLALYLAGGKKGSPILSVSTSPGVRFLHEFHGELGVNIGTSHSSGMKAAILIGGGRQMSLKMTYGYSDPMVLVENPTKKKLQFELKGMYENENRYLQKVLYARGRMQLTRYSGEEDIEIDPTVQTTYRECNSDQWISMIFRKKMCLEVVYPDVANSKTHAFFPLSGPFNLDVTIEDLDGANVTFYTLIMEYERQKVPGAGYTDHFDVAHVGTDHLKTETKYAYWNMVYTRDDYSLTIDAALIDFHYTYAMKFSNTWHRDIMDFTVSDMLSKSGFPVTGYIFQVAYKKDFGQYVFDYHWNVTSPQIGWDIKVQAISEDRYYKNFGDKSFDISVSYYCSKDRPLLYMFHLMPAWAAENNDVSNVRLTNSIEQRKDEKLPFSGSVEFYGHKLAWDSYVQQDGPTTSAHKVLTYSVGGVEKSATMDYSHTWGQSSTGLTLDLSGDIYTENFNVITTGSCTASKTEVVVSGDVQFRNKKEDNVSIRKKRSSFYDKLKAAEESAVNKALQIKDMLFGSDMVMDQPKPRENILLLQLQDTAYPRYSIWDLEDWNATVHLSSQLKPVFGDGVTPGTAPPDGIEATGTFTAQYPWNGGYVKHEELFTVGTNTRNTIRNFRIWLKGDMDTSYTTLDGTPVMDGSIPLVIKRTGEAHAFRKVGKYFDFVFNYQGPNLQKEYSILFDWDASTHHDPLYSVRSIQSGDIMPFWNHHYDEKFFYEDRHLLHNMEFSHDMLKISIDSELGPPSSDEMFHQNGSVSLKVMEKVWSFDFENKAMKKMFISVISPGSMPEKSYIYNMSIADSSKIMTITGSTEELEAKPVLLWTLDIKNRGSTMIEFTQSWRPEYQEQVENSLKQGMVRMAMMIQGAGDHIRANMHKPVSEQTLLFVHFTPGDLIRQAVMPNFIGGMKFWGRFLGNLVPLQYRPNSPDIPGPVIAPRFSILVQAMKDSENSGPNPMIRKLQFLDYVLLKAFGKVLLSVSDSELRTQKIEEILKEGQYSYVISTTPMMFKRLFDFPQMTEFHQHVTHQAKVIFGCVRRFYRDRSIEYTTPKSVAVIFGRHSSSNRELGIQTFDGNFLELTAEQSGECSYLLASDLRQRRWSLVLSPAGVTLMTPDKTVTVGWDKNVYLDNCKQPSTKISDGTVSVVKADEAVHVHTPFGLNLQFDIVHDNCLVVIEGSYRNETIGLLGTNDKEKFTDLRLKYGALTKDKKQFVAEYVVAGSKMCMSQKEEDWKIPEPECRDIERTCEKAFRSQRFFTCHEYFHFSQYCKKVGQRCVNVEQPCHAIKAFRDICREKGLIHGSTAVKGICHVEAPKLDSSMFGSMEMAAGSVDIVFVVSRHVSMTKNEVLDLTAVSDLALLDAWDQFSEVRLCVVLFGGSDAAPHVVRFDDNQNRPFTKRDDYDWDGLLDVVKLTAEGPENADAFEAIQEAASLSFNPVSQKIVIVLMTKEQSSGEASDILALSSDLKDKGITLHVISTYKKTASAKIVGINWEGKIISFDPGYSGKKSLPKNDYSDLITATQGALWDLHAIFTENQDGMKRMSEEFLTQIQQDDKQSCPAA